jgi:hypothetical protein
MYGIPIALKIYTIETSAYNDQVKAEAYLTVHAAGLFAVK